MVWWKEGGLKTKNSPAFQSGLRIYGKFSASGYAYIFYSEHSWIPRKDQTNF